MTARLEHRRADLASPDHLPACGLCGDLNEIGVRFCVGCGNPLTVDAASHRAALLTLAHHGRNDAGRFQS